ncbi:MAG: nucleoside hydrolase, partial [Spirochaetia bacterium]|nr:nucleoside hydrolase [Spirochaetia bacterium]
VDAVDLIIRTIEENPGEIILTCIAPLTNIAYALRKKPDIARKLKAIYLMGGELDLQRSEHNIAFDYNAAEIVFTSGIPLALGTWSVTRKFFLSKEDCAKFHTSKDPVNQALGKAIDVWHPVHHWKPGPVMYDVFPLVWAFNRSYYKTEVRSVEIETGSPLTRGMTIHRGNLKHIEVTTSIRETELKEFYLKTVLG